MASLLSKTLLMLLASVAVNAATITPFSNITSAKIKGTINAVMYGDDASCYPGPINVTIGVLDYQSGLDMMVDPLSENVIWQTVVGTLAPGALTFDFSVNTVIDGADITVAMPGDPYEKDITSLLQQVAADGNASGKAYALCVIVTGGSGKINLFASEAATPYADLLCLEIIDVNGTHVYKYKKTGGDPDNSVYDRIQYTGLYFTFNGWSDDGFAVGGHSGAPSGSYVGLVEDASAFFFHRGLAATLNWADPLYPNDVKVEERGTAAAGSLNLRNMPNPFTVGTRISYTLDRSVAMHLGVYDVSGRLIQTLADGVQSAGNHQTSLSAKDAPMGMYLLRLKAGDRTLNRKIMLMK